MLARVRAQGLLASGRDVVVLVSGGRDSTCLLDLAVRIAGASAVRALHVNYALRGSASDEDERHCAQLCRRLGVAIEVRRGGRDFHSRARGNLQQWAREVRYREARALAGSADLAAGHTATDQVETILYRLASSPSRRALLGMRPREGALVRPLLGFTREDTAAYCRARGLAWREDESNASGAYARNRIRSGLLPALLDDPLGRASATCSRWPRSCVARPRCSTRSSTTCSAAGRGSRSRRCAGSPARSGASSCSVWPTQRPAGSLRGRRGGPMSWPRSATGGRRCSTSGPGCGRWSSTASCGSSGSVAIRPRRRRRRASRFQGSVSFGRCEVSCELVAPAREPGVLDRAALGSSELLVRTWRPGDRMAPLGLGGTKSLQDLFTARRVPRLERGTVPVVEVRGEIVWVRGVATSERFKVTGATREAVRLSCRP